MAALVYGIAIVGLCAVATAAVDVPAAPPAATGAAASAFWSALPWLLVLLPSLIVGLTPYPRARRLVDVLKVALNGLSVVSHRDSPGTFKLPGVQSAPPHGIGDASGQWRDVTERMRPPPVALLLFFLVGLSGCGATLADLQRTSATVDDSLAAATDAMVAADLRYQHAIADPARDQAAVLEQAGDRAGADKARATALGELKAYEAKRDQIVRPLIARVKAGAAALHAGVALVAIGAKKAADVAGELGDLFSALVALAQVLPTAGGAP